MAQASNRVVRASSKVEWVPLAKTRVREGVSQREFRPHHPIFKDDFKLEKFHMPVVNKVGEWFWIVDGQHRVEGLKRWLDDWENQSVECIVYRGLSEKQEADLFRSLNNTKAVRAFDKFRTGLTAEYEDEINVQAAARRAGLVISDHGGDENAISCVSTLLGIYKKLGLDGLVQTLDIAFGAFGKEGLEADIVRGLGLVTGRYNGLVDTKRAKQSLSTLRGGAGQVRSRAERLRHQFGVNKAQAIAAACVEAYNRGKAGKKLPTWWKADA